jgi:hypothetical protein
MTSGDVPTSNAAATATTAIPVAPKIKTFDCIKGFFRSF